MSVAGNLDPECLLQIGELFHRSFKAIAAQLQDVDKVGNLECLPDFLVDREDMTIVLVDQEIRQALKIADFVYVLELGRNRFDGPVEEFTDLKKAFWV